MVEPLSPLAPVWKPGAHGNHVAGVGVVLSETAPGSIVQAAAWSGREAALIAAIKAITGLDLPDGAGAGVVADGMAAFGIAPGRFMLVDRSDGLAARLSGAITLETGTVTDLSNGRTAIHIEGAGTEWVLAKFFALDFALTEFPVGAGRASAHHDILAQIQRTGEDGFDIYVFRSFARSFWTALGHAADDVGYEVK